MDPTTERQFEKLCDELHEVAYKVSCFMETNQADFLTMTIGNTFVLRLNTKSKERSRLTYVGKTQRPDSW